MIRPYMIDQSHNVKDPVEALLMTVDQLQQAYAKALLVHRPGLAAFSGEERRGDGGANAQAGLRDGRASPSLPRRGGKMAARSIR